MTSPCRGTTRPFTVVCCQRCTGIDDVDVADALGQSIRRCSHGMLVSAGCLRGPLACAAHSHGCGAIVVLQPCAPDRRPDGPARWVGPILDDEDVSIVRAWVERGEWDREALPERMRIAGMETAASSRRN